MFFFFFCRFDWNSSDALRNFRAFERIRNWILSLSRVGKPAWQTVRKIRDCTLSGVTRAHVGGRWFNVGQCEHDGFRFSDSSGFIFGLLSSASAWFKADLHGVSSCKRRDARVTKRCLNCAKIDSTARPSLPLSTPRTVGANVRHVPRIDARNLCGDIFFFLSRFFFFLFFKSGGEKARRFIQAAQSSYGRWKIINLQEIVSRGLKTRRAD